MDKNLVIKEEVEKFVKAEKLFTSVDIGNAIKIKILSMEIRNREVRDWLRANLGTDPILTDYVMESIDINSGVGVATLYRPHWKDASEYINRDQKALTPADIDVLKDNVKPVTTIYGPSPVIAAMQNIAASSTAVNAPAPAPVAPTGRKDNSHIDINDVFNSDTVVGVKVQIVRKNKYVRRIQIPGDITRALGWKPGQNVDLDKIKIHTGTLSPKLKVWPDGRCSIPRKVVGYGKDPVMVILKDNAVYFEKA